MIEPQQSPGCVCRGDDASGSSHTSRIASSSPSTPEDVLARIGVATKPDAATRADTRSKDDLRAQPRRFSGPDRRRDSEVPIVRTVNVGSLY